MRTELIDKLKGTMVPIVTPMKDDYSLNLEKIPELIDYLIDGGVTVVIPCGSTGEFPSLNHKEREQVIKKTIDAVGRRVTTIAGVSHTRLSAVIELSNYAKDAGADGVLVTAPYYFLSNEDDVFDYFSRLDNAIDIPFLFYNNPSTTKLNASYALIERLSELRNFSGMKENNSQPVRYYEELKLFGNRFPVIPAGEPPAIFNMLTGAPGFISAAANFNPKLISSILIAAKEERIADAFMLFEKLWRYRSVFEARNRQGYPMYIVFAKAALNLMGFEVGPPRPPIHSPTSQELDQVREILRDEMGLPVAN